MIKREDLIKIGQFNKPHGIKGEVSFTFTNDIFDESECEFLVCEIDGIFVPFVIESYRFKSDTTALIKFDGIETDTQAKLFTNLDVYFPKQYLQEETSSEIASWDYFIGYTLIDDTLGDVGIITDVDETTINTLFIVERAGEEILIPASEDLMAGLDEENKIIKMIIPEGLIDL
ncbi:MAG: ribosome maturation factor RimM [Dysgonamonadaceae bacterium]|jgi:16S rRNA processing protein RimM|nr:ribosome maturation factor RimM [Dysgonamonadaceae bacterium]